MRTIRFTICLMALLQLHFLPLQASPKRVAGTVVSKTDSSPLVGASVVVKELPGWGTVTDERGKYTMELPESSEFTVQVSYMGFVTETAVVSADDHVKDFALEEDLIGMETVVVTGTRTPKSLKSVPVITRVITVDEIRKTDATNVVDVLEMAMPAIETSYSMDMQPSLNVQGFSGNSVLFLVDGERLAGETMNDVDFSRLNMEGVERVEIVRGAASSIYGSNAVGGVVNIITRTDTVPWAFHVNARYGAFDNQRYGGTLSLKAGKFNNILNVQHLRSGRIEYFNPETDGDKGAYNSMDPFHSWNFKDKLTCKVSDKFRLVANAGYFFRQRERTAIESNRYRDYSAGMKGYYSINSDNHIELSYAFDQYDKSDVDNIKGLDIRDYSNVQNTFKLLYNHTFSDKHTLTVGGDYMYDYLASYMFSGGRTYDQFVADAFAQFDWNPIERFNMVASARYDYYSESDAQNFSPQLNLMYKISNCAMRASYAVGFRAPTLKEMYSTFNMGSIWNIYGNPDLKPEKSHNFSLSAEFLKSRYNVTAVVYYNIIGNRIDVLWDKALDNGKGAMVYSNVSNMKIAGLNLETSAKYPFGLEVRLSYAYTYQSEKYNQYVAAARPHAGTVRLDYGKQWKRYGFNISLSGRILSSLTSKEYNSINDPSQGTYHITYPAYTMWKLNLTQKIWRGINLNLAVDNLFNYKPSYYYFNSPYTTGTTLSVGLSLDVDKMF